MAGRRMFSPQIIDSDAFLDMPASSQLLYFHLVMRADDDGFVGNPKKILRMLGGTDDDYKVLIMKRFILVFESGVIVIKHWRIHNLIRHDRYHETQYLEEKSSLIIKENGAYTELATNRQPVGNHVAPEVKLSKVKRSNNTPAEGGTDIAEFIHLFEEINPSTSVLYGRTNQRAASERLLKQHPLAWWQEFMRRYAAQLNDRYCPKATTPVQLEDKLGAIMAYAKALKSGGKMITV